MHKESGEGWSLDHANAIETEYRRFLYLMKAFPHVQTAPLVDVDTFWHYHILDTMKYARDCEQAFGYFVHHYPYLGLMGENDAELQQQAGERMRELYESTFGVSYVRPLRTDGALEAADVQTASDPAMRQAANSAWCFVSPGICQGAAGSGVPDRLVRLKPGQSSGRSRRPDRLVRSAPGIVKAADVQTAWCVFAGHPRKPHAALTQAHSSYVSNLPAPALPGRLFLHCECGVAQLINFNSCSQSSIGNILISIKRTLTGACQYREHLNPSCQIRTIMH